MRGKSVIQRSMIKTAEKYLLEFDPKAENILPALKRINAVFGLIEEKTAEKIADYFGVPLSKIYETATFYDLLETRSKPPVVIKICSGTNCSLCGARRVAETIENFFHIRPGDEAHPKIRLETESCLGLCDNGPVLEINGNVYTKVAPGNVLGIIKEYI